MCGSVASLYGKAHSSACAIMKRPRIQVMGSHDLFSLNPETCNQKLLKPKT